jgi:thiol-disulfide isomerase/thioredoxin
MYERLLITFAVMAFAWVVLSLLRRRQITQSNRASQRLNKASNLPTIVYFWSEGCSVCKMTQRPILERILAEYGKERVALTAYNID